MKTFTLRIIVTALLLSAVSFAAPDPDNRGRQKLNLTDAQKEQFEKISFDSKKKQIELKAKLESAQLDVRRLMKAETVDKSAIEKKWNEIASFQVALKMNHLNAWVEKNKVLTPEQQKQWKEMRGHHAKKVRQPMKRRGMMMAPPSAPMMERRIERKIERETQP